MLPNRITLPPLSLPNKFAPIICHLQGGQTNLKPSLTQNNGRVSFRIFVGGGGANMTFAELKGARNIVLL